MKQIKIIQRKKNQCYSYYLLLKKTLTLLLIFPSIYICGALFAREEQCDINIARSRRAMSHYVMRKRAMQYKQAIKFNKQYLSHYNNNVTYYSMFIEI